MRIRYISGGSKGLTQEIPDKEAEELILAGMAVDVTTQRKKEASGLSGGGTNG